MKSKVALITGATDGIGKAAALQLLREGWEVVLTGRSEAKCAAVVEEFRKTVPEANVTVLVADLSSMAQVKKLAEEFRAKHQQLSVLVLNANSITQEFTRTAEGFEANFAVGFLGRVLLLWQLQEVLQRTEGAVVLTVVGLNLERIGFDDPSAERGYSSMKALGRWQWAMQVFAREWNRRVPSVLLYSYMPGLVKTKILANEPQPMRLFVQLANYVMGLSVEQAGAELVAVIHEVRTTQRKDGYYNRTKFQGVRKLKEQPDDPLRLWNATERWLAAWR